MKGKGMTRIVIGIALIIVLASAALVGAPALAQMVPGVGTMVPCPSTGWFTLCDSGPMVPQLQSAGAPLQPCGNGTINLSTGCTQPMLGGL
jgi:hypothetical protein